jgi:hypothetical protein
MRLLKRSRAVAKSPRVKTLCARSKALSAAASSCEGCLGAGAGVGLAAGRCDAAFAAGAFEGFDGLAACFWGLGLGAGLFLAAAFVFGEGRAFPPAFFAGFDFAGLLACFEAGRELLAADFAGAAFRTGGFCAAARLGLGFADLADGLRLLAEDFCGALCGAVREEPLLAPLMTGSLMRSTRFSQIASEKKEAADLQKLNI